MTAPLVADPTALRETLHDLWHHSVVGCPPHQSCGYRDRARRTTDALLASGVVQPLPPDMSDLPDGPLTAHLLRMQEIIEGVADLTSGGRSGMEAFLLAHSHHAQEIAALYRATLTPDHEEPT